MSESTHDQKSTISLDSFFQFTIHKISPVHPKCTIDTEKTQIVVDLFDLSQSSRRTYSLKQNAFTPVKETLAFRYNREALLDGAKTGLRVYLKVHESDNEKSVFAHCSMNVANMLGDDMKRMGPRWLPFQGTEKHEQIVAFICVSAVALKTGSIAENPLFDAVSAQEIEGLNLRENDVAGSLALEQNKFYINLSDLEFIHSSISKFDVELVYGDQVIRKSDLDGKYYLAQSFEFATTVPVISEYVYLKIYHNEEVVSVFKKPIFEFVISRKRKMLSLNLVRTADGTLVARLIGRYESSLGRKTRQSFVALPDELTQNLNMIEKENFKMAIDFAAIGNLEPFEGEALGVKVRWGQAEQTLSMTQIKSGQLIVNRRIMLESEFTFVDENFDALPQPEIYIINQEGTVLFWKSLHVKDAQVLYDQSYDSKIKFRSYLVDNKREGEYTPLLHLKFFIYESEKKLVIKRLSSKPDTTRDPCFFLIDVISLVSKKLLSTTAEAKLLIKHNEVTSTVDIKQFSTFNWVNAKISLSSYRLDHLIAPLYVWLAIDGLTPKDAVVDYNQALDGIPQRVEIDKDVELVLVMRFIHDEQLFRNSIIVNQVLYRSLEGSMNQFIDNSTPVSHARPDVSTYKVVMNVWKVENFTSEVNRMWIRNPYLSIMTSPLHMKSEVERDARYGASQKYLFPRDPTPQHNLTSPTDMPFGSQLEMEFNLPADYRLLPKFDIGFVEKSIQKERSAFEGQMGSNDELFLGTCKLDLFYLIVESKMVLFKRLHKLHKIINKLNIGQKAEVRELIRLKLLSIEADLEFNKRYKQKIKGQEDEDLRRLFFRAVHNVLESVDNKVPKPKLQDIKALNGFYAIKARLLEQLNDGSMDKTSHLSLAILPALVNKLGMSFDGAKKTEAPKADSQETPGSSPVALSKYVLNESTMRDIDHFVIKPRYIKVDREKKETDVPSPQLYYKVAKDSKSDCHYRYILPCPLESSAYLEDYSSWSSYALESHRDKRVADLRSKITVSDEKDQEFFKQLDKYGIDSKLYGFQAGEVFSSYTPSEKLKINVYLLDMLIHDEIAEDELILEVRVGNAVIRRIQVDELNASKEGSIEILETVEHSSRVDKVRPLTLNLVRRDFEFNEEVTIATTSLDIEQRFFCNSWRRLKDKPIETRNMVSTINGSLMGKCRLWLDIHQKSDSSFAKKCVLKKPSANELEARLVVWGLDNYQLEGRAGKREEIYVQGEFISTNKLSCLTDKIQQTTARFITKPQAAVDFNYRMVWGFKGGRGSHRLQLSLYNVSTGNNLEAHIDLSDLSRQVLETGKAASAAVDDVGNFADFYLPTTVSKTLTPAYTSEDLDSSNTPPKLRVRLEILPVHLARAKPAGQGRNHPNMDPYLPEPLRGNYPKTESITDVYNEIPKNIKYELAVYLFVFLMGFVFVLLAGRSLVNLMF